MKQVTAAVIIEEGRLLLTRRPPGDPLAGLWELPGGKIEAGETPAECLKRELTEELDMRALIGDVAATTTYTYDHGSFEMIALLATRLSDYELRVHDASVWVSRDEIASIQLAPADIALVAGILEAGHW